MDLREKLLQSQERLNAVVTIIDKEESVDGPLKDIPVAIKDNYSTKGVLTTGGSEILDNYVPVYDAVIVERLKAAGADLVCKTTLDELSMGGTGTNFAKGPSKNPYDPERITGGSSAGSAALVGAHLLDYALGTDTGDSIRKPAAYCGCIGFKPTYGLLPRYGIIPYASSLDHAGFLTRTVDQSALLLSVLAGRDDRDLTSLNIEKEDYTSLDESLEGKVFGVLEEILDAKYDDLYKEKYLELLRKLEEKGAEIKYLSIDRKLLASILPVYNIIANCEATANHSNLDGVRFGHRVDGASLSELMINSRTRGFGSLLKRRFVIGAYGLDDAHQEDLFRKAQRVRRLLVEEYKKGLDLCDAIILPTTDSIAPKISDLGNIKADRDQKLVDSHLILANLAGNPSISLPLGFVDDMPISVNLAGKTLDEKNLLGLAKGVEKLINFASEEKEVNPWLI